MKWSVFHGYYFSQLILLRTCTQSISLVSRFIYLSQRIYPTARRHRLNLICSFVVLCWWSHFDRCHFRLFQSPTPLIVLWIVSFIIARPNISMYRFCLTSTIAHHQIRETSFAIHGWTSLYRHHRWYYDHESFFFENFPISDSRQDLNSALYVDDQKDHVILSTNTTQTFSE